MAKTKYWDLTGEVYWAMVYEPDEYSGSHRWKLNLHLKDDDEWLLYKESGIRLEIKENEAGKYIAPRRDCTRNWDGKVVKMAPPRIFDAEGEVLVGYKTDEDGEIMRYGNPVLIGNGSVCKVRLSSFPTANGIGHRLESVTILDLIEYERPELTMPEVEPEKLELPF